MRNAENLQFLLRETDAAQHETVAAQRLDGVDAHAAEHLLDLVPPCGHEVHETLTAFVGIESLDERRILRSDAPVAVADLAAAAEVTAERRECRRGDIAGVSAECNRLDNIGR